MGPLLVSFLIGCVAGLRSLTAPAAICWAAHFGWLRVAGTQLAFIGHPITLAVFSVLALFELIVDKLPKTPARTAPIGLGARVVFGAGCAFALATSSRTSPLLDVVSAAVGSVLAAFFGYNVRHLLVVRLHLPDFVVAIAEDVVAVAGVFLILRHAWASWALASFNQP